MSTIVVRRRTWKPNEVADADRVPENTSVPTISGTGAVDEVLTASPGSWDRAVQTDYRYQWNLDGVAIDGAEDVTYVVAAGDSGHNITVTVTARNVCGAASATSTNKAVS